MVKQEKIVEKFTAFLAADSHPAKKCGEVAPLAVDPEVKKAFEFLSRLNTLAEKYQFQPQDIILLLDPGYGAVDIANDVSNSAPNRKRKPRSVKCYRNPYSGERIETRGANHKLLKQWKADHGAEVVEGWREPPRSVS